MQYLLTGGYGCIGSWIANKLLDQGHDVAIYDVREDTSRMALIMSPEKSGQIDFIEGDITDGDTFTGVARDLDASCIFHLAGLQVPVCRENPVMGAMVNVVGTLNVLETARILKDQVTRVVYASSGAVYGMEEEYDTGPVSNDAQLKPLTHYGVFKQCNEGNARVAYLDHGVSSIGLRPWTVYGPGRDFGLTSDPTKAVKAALLGRPFVIEYGGRNNMQYVGDTADIFIRCAQAEFEGAEAYSIRGEVVDIQQVIAAIEQVMPEAAGLITHTENTIPIAPDLDASRLDREIGNIANTSLIGGIKETMEVFRACRASGTLDTSDLDS